MNEIARTWAIAGLFVFAYMTAWFVVALALRRNDIADVAWGLGFPGIAVVLLALPSSPRDPRQVLVAALVAVWGLRLAYHIFRRNFRTGHAEDVRYATWRREWGRWFVVRTYLQIFVLQGLFMLIVAAPLVVTAADAGPALGLIDAVGVAVWVVGLAFEAIGDAQLARHLSRPEKRGTPLTTGLWAWTRHPNYFGDATQWTGIGIVGLSAPLGWVGLVGPLAMTLLLRYVSGVPMLEARHVGEPAWDAYRAHTSVMFPLPPGRRR